MLLYTCIICQKIYNRDEVPTIEAGMKVFRCDNCGGVVAEQRVNETEVVVDRNPAPLPFQSRALHEQRINSNQASGVGDFLVWVFLVVVILIGIWVVILIGIWVVDWFLNTDFETPKRPIIFFRRR